MRIPLNLFHYLQICNHSHLCSKGAYKLIKKNMKRNSYMPQNT